jgi:hypothetical protein
MNLYSVDNVIKNNLSCDLPTLERLYKYYFWKNKGTWYNENEGLTHLRPLMTVRQFVSHQLRYKK